MLFSSLPASSGFWWLTYWGGVYRGKKPSLISPLTPPAGCTYWLTMQLNILTLMLIKSFTDSPMYLVSVKSRHWKFTFNSLWDVNGFPYGIWYIDISVIALILQLISTIRLYEEQMETFVCLPFHKWFQHQIQKYVNLNMTSNISYWVLPRPNDPQSFWNFRNVFVI